MCVTFRIMLAALLQFVVVKSTDCIATNFPGMYVTDHHFTFSNIYFVITLLIY